MFYTRLTSWKLLHFFLMMFFSLFQFRFVFQYRNKLKFMPLTNSILFFGVFFLFVFVQNYNSFLFWWFSRSWMSCFCIWDANAMLRWTRTDSATITHWTYFLSLKAHFASFNKTDFFLSILRGSTTNQVNACIGFTHIGQICNLLFLTVNEWNLVGVTNNH